MSPDDAEVEQSLRRLFDSEPSESTGRAIDARLLEMQTPHEQRRAASVPRTRRIVLGLGVASALVAVLAGIAAFAPQLLPEIGPPVRTIDRGSTAYDLGDLPRDAAMFAGNHLIVAGTIAGHSSSRWASNDTSYIYTPVLISVDRVLRGAYDQATVTVQSPGGRIGGLEMRFNDQTDLRRVPVGTDVLLFLSDAVSGSGVPPTPNMAYTVADGIATGLGPERHQIAVDEFLGLIAQHDTQN